MAVNVKRYQQLKADVDRLQRQRDQAEGALGVVMKSLEDGFGCKTLKEAERLAAKLKREADEAEREFDESLAAFEEKWGDVLEGEM